MNNFASDDILAGQCARFAERITSARARWEYCYNRSVYSYTDRYGVDWLCLNDRAIPACARLLGVYERGAKFRLHKIREMGIEAAFEWGASRRHISGGEYFKVGTLQLWHIGHIYRARVKSHPHVMKVGFSRRVRERLIDLESDVKAGLFLDEDGLTVGSHVDERHLHHSLAKYRISGEWFFDPSSTDRSVPDFLSEDFAGRAA